MNLVDVSSSDPGRIILKSSEFNKKRTKTTLPDISRNLQHDFGGTDPSNSDPSGHLSGSGSSPSSESGDSTDFSPIKIAEKDLGLSPLRLLPGFAVSIKKRKQFLASMSPPRELFSQFPALVSLENAETEEHEENAQDENEDDGPFASEALSDSEEDKSPKQVLVIGRRFKETLREEKPPRVQVGNSRKQRPGEVDSAEAVQALKLHRKQQAEERAGARRRRWKALDSPKDCAYIQIDGMDQKKTALLHFSKQPKSVDGVALVGVHLVGAMIFHGKLHTQPKLFRTLNDITQNQQYKFKIASALEVRVWCKQFSTDNTWEPPAGVRNILHIDGSRAILASEQVPLKSYAEIKRQTRRVQNIGPLIGMQEGEGVRYVQAIRQDIQTHCYPFFDDEQKDWWNHWFVQQEEIGRNISNNRRERLVGDMCWFWPVPPERDEHAVDEPVVVTTTEEFRRRIFRQRRPIYSGPRRPAPGSATADRAAHIGELTEIQEKSFLAVLADDETSFWICQVLKINRRNEEGKPTSVHIQWYATEDSNPYTRKFYPEKRRTNGKGRAALFRQEITLEEVNVLSFNFIFTTARRLRKVTEKQIRTSLFRIARDKVASQPEVCNRLSEDIDSADDEETECSGPDLEEEEE
ncbi:hypothetical protein R1sor_003682 [Riccia sorocarpa]|uniref:Uncharacterized protein n=1 Tax=Riccia sorocarpa TaxID=122646 RepID=A0ABD3H5N6_9MARC